MTTEINAFPVGMVLGAVAIDMVPRGNAANLFSLYHRARGQPADPVFLRHARLPSVLSSASCRHALCDSLTPQMRRTVRECISLYNLQNPICRPQRTRASRGHEALSSRSSAWR